MFLNLISIQIDFSSLFKLVIINFGIYTIYFNIIYGGYEFIKSNFIFHEKTK